jgi:hypothetical protein
MLTSPSVVMRIVSFPKRFPDSPSAARNQRSARVGKAFATG